MTEWKKTTPSINVQSCNNKTARREEWPSNRSVRPIKKFFSKELINQPKEKENRTARIVWFLPIAEELLAGLNSPVKYSRFVWSNHNPDCVTVLSEALFLRLKAVFCV